MQSLYLKHPHGFILLCFSHQFLSPLVENLWKIPEDNIFAFICFGLNPLLSFSFEFSCSLFSHREPPGFFHFILRLCYWTRWSSFILCFSGSERKKERKNSRAVGFNKHFYLVSSSPRQLRRSNSTQSGSTTPMPVSPGFWCRPATKNLLQLYWPLLFLTLSSLL